MSSVLSLLRQAKAVLTHDHFVYTSGKHGDAYINKDALYPHVQLTEQVCLALAKKCQKLDIDTIVAPALGGIILSQWMAYHLSILKRKEIFGVYLEKDTQKNFLFSRGYDRFVVGKNVLVVEDLTTTGGSVKKVVDAVRSRQGKVVGVCVMANRNPDVVKSDVFGAPLIVGAVTRAQAWDEADCPLCKAGLPINTTVGHGKTYVQSKTA